MFRDLQERLRPGIAFKGNVFVMIVCKRHGADDQQSFSERGYRNGCLLLTSDEKPVLSAGLGLPSRGRQNRCAAIPAHVARGFVKVGVYVNPPFVLKEGDGYSGMAVELWQKVAADLAVVSKYEEFQNDTDLVEAVANGTVHAAVTNFSITTAERNG